MSPQAETDAREIRDRRAHSNAALAAGDLGAFLETIDVDYTGSAGNGGHIRSHSALKTLIGGLFEDRPGLFFVRTPSEVEVGESGKRAIEVGRWQEVLPGEEGSTASGMRGRYSAFWRLIDGAWVIHAEIFVTLGEG